MSRADEGTRRRGAGGTRPLTRLIAAGLALLLAGGALAPVAGGEGASNAATGQWRDSYAGAMKEARAANKPLLLVFFTTWCVYCAKMHKTTLEAPEVVEALAGYVPALVDAEGDLVAAKRFKPAGFPVVVIVEPGGREIARFVGYQPPDAFAASLHAVSGHLSDLTRLVAEAEGKNGEAAWAPLGDLYGTCGLPALAFAQYDRALKRVKKGAPEREPLLARAGEAARLAGNATEGQRCFERLLEEFPASPRRPDYLLGLGRTLLDEGHPDRARTVLERLPAEHGGTPQADEAGKLLAGAPAR